MSDKLAALVKEFFDLTDGVEVSDNNRMFRPTNFHISSCRAMSVKRLADILEEMRLEVQARPRTTDKEIYLFNDPEGCGECLGEGLKYNNACKACGGSGSSNPWVCKVCKGTGDSANHERDSHPCYTCNETGIDPDYQCPDCKGKGWSVDCQTCKGEGHIA